MKESISVDELLRQATSEIRTENRVKKNEAKAKAAKAEDERTVTIGEIVDALEERFGFDPKKLELDVETERAGGFGDSGHFKISLKYDGKVCDSVIVEGCDIASMMPNDYEG